MAKKSTATTILLPIIAIGGAAFVISGYVNAYRHYKTTPRPFEYRGFSVIVFYGARPYGVNLNSEWSPSGYAYVYSATKKGIKEKIDSFLSGDIEVAVGAECLGETFPGSICVDGTLQRSSE